MKNLSISFFVLLFSISCNKQDEHIYKKEKVSEPIVVPSQPLFTIIPWMDPSVAIQKYGC